uniref:DNA oxidative demethylase ALKBH2 n=1 Tax=Latimeria chalumnae TaxID=7897 RepID=H3AX90_LATCH
MDKFVIVKQKSNGKRKHGMEENKCKAQLKKKIKGEEAKDNDDILQKEECLLEYKWKKIKAVGLDCDYTKLFTKLEADDIFQQLERELEYFSVGDLTRIQVFGKTYNIPRKQVTYGDSGLIYTYSGVTLAPKPWIPILESIRDRVTKATGHTFNFVLINRYKDGNDHIGEHRDDERELDPRSPIASVSFGACRDFIFRHGASRGKNPTQKIEPIKLELEHGSLLMMNYPTNVYWYHSLPVRKKIPVPRINLTFRKIV